MHILDGSLWPHNGILRMLTMQRLRAASRIGVGINGPGDLENGGAQLGLLSHVVGDSGKETTWRSGILS